MHPLRIFEDDGNANGKAKTGQRRKFVLVRYGRMNNLGLFEHNEAQVPRTPTRVVVKTDKGLELGHLVGQPSSYKDGRFRLAEDQICSYLRHQRNQLQQRARRQGGAFCHARRHQRRAAS